MTSFDPFHFSSSFNSSPYYDGKLNGFDVMIMESAERADKVIKDAKAVIDSYAGTGVELSFTYDDTDILPPDQSRIDREVEKYARLRNVVVK